MTRDSVLRYIYICTQWVDIMAGKRPANSLEDLESFISTCPVIDNHAHNLYTLANLKTKNLLPITTEAADEALQDTKTSLPHLRAAKQLRRLFDLPADADWQAIIQKRAALLKHDSDALIQKCLENTQTILIDDGFDEAQVLEPFQWHDKFTRSPCKRLVRIEELASDILSDLHDEGQLPNDLSTTSDEACQDAWEKFLATYSAAILDAFSSPSVAGFKSAICFTVGLSISPDSDNGLHSFSNEFLPTCVENDFDIKAKGMNDALVTITCRLLSAAHSQQKFTKPLQFHTGIGNKEIPVLTSNPAYLQPVIEAFSDVPIILLHASYPYTRIAGYLATVFKNVYLDISAVFPEISRDGQEKVLRECVEMTPWTKLLLETDGHWFPETFWLANVQGREALKKVLGEYVREGDLSVEEAISGTRQILFENANVVYGLGLELVEVL